MRVVLQRGPKSTVVELDEANGKLTATVDGVAREVDVIEADQGLLSMVIDGRVFACDFERKGDKVRVAVGQSLFEVEPLDERRARRQLAAGLTQVGGPQVLLAPMPGKVVRLLVKLGQSVKAGEGVVVVEAMKMENELRAVRDGVVKVIAVQEGVPVEGGAKLVVLE